MIRTAPTLAAAVLATLAAAPLAAQTDAADLERGRTLSRWMAEEAVDSLFAHMSRDFAESIGGPRGLSLLLGRLDARAGDEVEVRDEAVFHEGGLTSYYRISRYERMPSVTAHWVWDGSGTVQGASVRPTSEPAPTEHLEYETRADLRLPFEGTWYVAWGGREPHLNYHVASPDQRFAYDFVATRDGAFHSGDGTRNEDHFCWDAAILAPAAGTVVAVVDSVPDNPRPGVRNADAPPGNHVVIDHGAGEFSLLAHLRLGSVEVAPGERVARGQRVGACGNSGNSTQPHLHYHLQTGPAFGQGTGLPAAFRDYRADGDPVERGEPVRGETVSPGGKGG